LKKKKVGGKVWGLPKNFFVVDNVVLFY